MRARVPTIAAWIVLGGIAVATFLLPDTLSVPSVRAQQPVEMRHLGGIVRAFRTGHVDFGVFSATESVHAAGLVEPILSIDGRPVLITGCGAVTNFAVEGQEIAPDEGFAVQAAVLGAAGEHAAVTARLRVGDRVFEPFGPYADPAHGSLVGPAGENAGQRVVTLDGEFAAGASIAMAARTWSPDASSDSGWRPGIEASTSQTTGRVQALRDGDPVPASGGLPAACADYVDRDTHTVRLAPHQVLYLFELTAVSDRPLAGFQDLAILVSLAERSSCFEDGAIGRVRASGGYEVVEPWRDAEGRAIPPNLADVDSVCEEADDVPGARGDSSRGGVHSADSFDQWFRDVLGVNRSAPHAITLLRDRGGIWSYVDHDFDPVDAVMRAELPGGDAAGFTYALEAEFEYQMCAGHFVELGGGDGGWMFIDDRLAIDLGGVAPRDAQYISLDRLGLEDGQKYRLKVFYAKRRVAAAGFRLRTSLDLHGVAAAPMVSSAFVE